MPALFTADTVDGSEFDLRTESPAKSRGGIVTNISGDPATAIDQVVDAIKNAGFAFGSTATFNGQTVYLHRMAGRAVGVDSFRVQLIYDSDFGGQNSAYVITTRGYTQAYQSHRMPGTRAALFIPKWTNGTNTADFVPGDNANGTFDYPMRMITVSGIKSGANPAAGTYDKWIGYANDAGFLGLAKGYWKIVDGNNTVSKYSGFYNYSLSAVTKNIEDLRQIYTLFNTRLGVYVQVAASNEAQLLNAPYDYGNIGQVPGAIAVGPNPLVSYAPLFGFS